jgi:hypothetical protein
VYERRKKSSAKEKISLTRNFRLSTKSFFSLRKEISLLCPFVKLSCKKKEKVLQVHEILSSLIKKKRGGREKYSLWRKKKIHTHAPERKFFSSGLSTGETSACVGSKTLQ